MSGEELTQAAHEVVEIAQERSFFGRLGERLAQAFNPEEPVSGHLYIEMTGREEPLKVHVTDLNFFARGVRRAKRKNRFVTINKDNGTSLHIAASNINNYYSRPLGAEESEPA